MPVTRENSFARTWERSFKCILGPLFGGWLWQARFRRYYAKWRKLGLRNYVRIVCLRDNPLDGMVTRYGAEYFYLEDHWFQDDHLSD